jgi:hypothetical protein
VGPGVALRSVRISVPSTASSTVSIDSNHAAATD